MTLFSVENSEVRELGSHARWKSWGQDRTPYECQVLVRSQYSSCRFVNLVPTMYKSSQYNLWHVTGAKLGHLHYNIKRTNFASFGT